MAAMSRTFVLDNGGGSIKAGWSDQEAPAIIVNAKAKTKSGRKVHTGALINSLENKAGLLYKRPFQRGYLTDTALQCEIWRTVFSELSVTPADTSLLVTEPVFNFDQIKESLHELVFEELGFASLYRAPAADLCAFNACSGGAPGCVIVDSGFSFSHAIPYLYGKRIDAGVRRLDLGGKALTNHLKDVVSYRELDVSDESYVVDEMKKKTSFVSTEFMTTLKEAKGRSNPHAVEYVLPDFAEIKEGFAEAIEGPVGKKRKVEPSKQSLVLLNERFTIPELLFTPADIGIAQAGLSVTVQESIDALAAASQPLACSNIMALGGNACMPGFRDRLFNDVRSNTPADIEVVVTAPDAPDLYAWHSARAFAQQDGYAAKVVTKAEWEESGHKVCFKRFDGRD